MREDEKKLARTARRNAGNEATLVWALFGSFLSVALILSDPILLFIGFGLPMWILISFALSTLAALVWYLNAQNVIEQAKLDYNEIMKAKKAEMNEEHLETLRKRNE
ncbi:MAG TPA: hypothetical protein ENJ91_00675 [Rhodobacteraceae bacterium]|nr:hypothetical protein [Paracoccaceae bacterium]